MELIVIIAVFLSNFLSLSFIKADWGILFKLTRRWLALGIGWDSVPGGLFMLVILNCDLWRSPQQLWTRQILLAVGGRLPHFVELFDGLLLAFPELAVLLARVGVHHLCVLFPQSVFTFHHDHIVD